MVVMLKITMDAASRKIRTLCHPLACGDGHGELLRVAYPQAPYAVHLLRFTPPLASVTDWRVPLTATSPAGHG